MLTRRSARWIGACLAAALLASLTTAPPAISGVTSVSEAGAGTRDVWARRTDARAHAGGYWIERQRGARAKMTFMGSTLLWYTITGPTFGKAAVYVDGKLVRTVDNYSSTVRFRVGRRIRGFSPGRHKVVIKVLGTRSSSARDTRVAVDTFKVDGTILASPNVSFTWGRLRVGIAVGGTAERSVFTGARSTFTFTGKGVDWLTLRGPQMGKADLLLDGKRVRTVDLYAPATARGVISLAGLAPRQHTLAVVVRSDRNRAARGKDVYVDGWRIVRPSVAAFRQLGTWVDLFDYGLDPAAATAAMSSRGVRTLYLQTARWNSDTDIVNPDAVGAWIEEAHARKIKVVGWYLPAYAEWLDRDMRRTLAMHRYRSPAGQRFDAIAVDIEYKGQTESLDEFNTGVVRHLSRVRRNVGNFYPVGAIIPAPRGMALSPSSWAGFPFASIGRYADVVLPMGYWSYRTDRDTNPAHEAGRYTRDNITEARAKTGLPVHIIGGVADDVTASEVSRFTVAANDARAIGGSLYDYRTTASSFWSRLAPLNG